MESAFSMCAVFVKIGNIFYVMKELDILAERSQSNLYFYGIGGKGRRAIMNTCFQLLTFNY